MVVFSNEKFKSKCQVWDYFIKKITDVNAFGFSMYCIISLCFLVYGWMADFLGIRKEVEFLEALYFPRKETRQTDPSSNATSSAKGRSWTQILTSALCSFHVGLQKALKFFKSVLQEHHQWEVHRGEGNQSFMTLCWGKGKKNQICYSMFRGTKKKEWNIDVFKISPCKASSMSVKPLCLFWANWWHLERREGFGRFQ